MVKIQEQVTALRPRSLRDNSGPEGELHELGTCAERESGHKKLISPIRKMELCDAEARCTLNTRKCSSQWHEVEDTGKDQKTQGFRVSLDPNQ